jgi:hypothetical protein
MHGRWDILKYMNQLHQTINGRSGERGLMGTPNLPETKTHDDEEEMAVDQK